MVRGLAEDFTCLPLFCFANKITDISPSIPVLEWEGESLELTRISRLDMGAYLCIASNGVPPSVSKRIKVSVDCKYYWCSMSVGRVLSEPPTALV